MTNDIGTIVSSQGQQRIEGTTFMANIPGHHDSIKNAEVAGKMVADIGAQLSETARTSSAYISFTKGSIDASHGIKKGSGPTRAYSIGYDYTLSVLESTEKATATDYSWVVKSLEEIAGTDPTKLP